MNESLKRSMIQAVVGMTIGAVAAFAACWFFETVLHLPDWLGLVAVVAVYGLIQHHFNQAEEKQQKEIAAAFEEQQRHLKIAKKRLAHLKRETE